MKQAVNKGFKRQGQLGEAGEVMKVRLGAWLLAGAVLTQVAPAAAAAKLKVAYVHKKAGAQERDAFRTLITGAGYSFDGVRVSAAAAYDFSTVDLIVVSDESGSYSWGTPEAVANVRGSNKPVLGIGEGGSSYFQQIEGLHIRNDDAWYHSSALALPVDATARLWTDPTVVKLGVALDATLYTAPSELLAVYLPVQITGVKRLARQVESLTHYPIVSEKSGGRVHVLWGYRAGPQVMTKSGKNLFINLMAKTLRMA